MWNLLCLRGEREGEREGRGGGEGEGKGRGRGGEEEKKKEERGKREEKVEEEKSLVSFLCEVYNTNTKHCTEGPQEMFPQKNQQNSTGESRTNGHILCGKGTSH